MIFFLPKEKAHFLKCILKKLKNASCKKDVSYFCFKI